VSATVRIVVDAVPRPSLAAMRFAAAAAVAAAAVTAAAAAAVPAPPASCSGAANTFPVWAGTPTPVANVTNGRKAVVPPPANSSSAPVIVLHVYGSDYEMGVAYGSLLRAEISDLVPKVWAYMYAQMNSSLAWIAEPWRDAVMTAGLEAALNLTYAATAPFTPPAWADMFRGIADGSGVDVGDVIRLNMIPEFIKAQCSMAGAWGAATAGAGGGSLYQLRALDWGTDGPFQAFPVVATFHPAPGAGVPFTTLSWAGLVGAITGMSSSGLAISEKVWDGFTGRLSGWGYGWTQLLADILRFDVDTDRALSRIASANRTCAIFVGIGDAAAGTFKYVQYSNPVVDVVNTRNFVPWQNHPAFADLLFINKHVQPSTDPCMTDTFTALYGNIDAAALFQQVSAFDETGNMHIAVYDFARSLMYVSNASPGDGHGNGVVNAYAQPFLQFNMTEMWATPAP
jgi:hypothetical protein